MNFLTYDMLAIANVLVNGLVFGICICRLGKMHDALLRVKAQYVFLLVASAASGASPIFFQQWPTAVSIVYALAVLNILISDSYQWRQGTPTAAISGYHPPTELPDVDPR